MKEVTYLFWKIQTLSVYTAHQTIFGRCLYQRTQNWVVVVAYITRWEYAYITLCWAVFLQITILKRLEIRCSLASLYLCIFVVLPSDHDLNRRKPSHNVGCCCCPYLRSQQATTTKHPQCLWFVLVQSVVACSPSENDCLLPSGQQTA